MPVKFKRFEEMPVWIDSRKLTVLIYQLTSGKQFQKDFGLRDQIQRSAVSVMSNISEGYERGNNKEFIHFLLYSKGSVGEVRSQLYVALDICYITQEEFKAATDLASSISSQLSSFVKFLRSKELQ